MSFYEFEGKRPKIESSAFVHPEAVLIGGVTIAGGCYVGAGAVLRGDFGNIMIEKGSNIQENCVIHAAPGITAHLGPSSHIGHGAILHGVTLGEHVSIGMAAVIDEEVTIGDGSIIGASCLLPRGTKIPAFKLVVGIPGKIVGDVTPEKKDYTKWATRQYQELTPRCHKGLRRIDEI